MTTIGPVTPHPGAASSYPETASDAPQVKHAAGSQAQAHDAQGSSAEAANAGNNPVQVSDKANAAKAMMRGAQKPAMSKESVQAWAKLIASGMYRPPPKSVAEALVRFESAFLSGK